ncbi:MAG: UTP-glucose-1-phosphate uridylyltransferase [Candidatus Magasanikbacteria bacterium GW2011_GWA2_37_8]|uniref:UTP--glucose-1-phosphate uridylyltransferase n=1 Tax=Candidatus Magasanikbacteria bacterium GW2011_GWA2_37_8 TaxID=1619036 RepID=A0A0G0KK81_9BACT|nr:MAG: UTP-glucose-1-phosphate uridylyltransferase [Candidatus Magasanikbacteria bacterium GW2011_GWA2_37_8]
MSKVLTAVIPAGGHGTRFLPASKSIPKEMFPIGEKPVIYHVVEEVVKAGITNIIFVVAHHKHSIEDFFSPNEEFEDYLKLQGKKDKTKMLVDISNMAEFTFVYSKPPYGNGAPIAAVEHLIKDEPFVLVWGDEFVINKGVPRVRQCIDAFETYGKSVVSAFEIKEAERRQLYGMAKLKSISKTDDTVQEILDIVEKPKPGKEPSVYATHGAYVLTPKIFEALKHTKPDKKGELWLTDMLDYVQKKEGLIAKIIKDADYLDCGNPLFYLLSQIDYAIKKSDYSEEVFDYVKKLGACKID